MTTTRFPEFFALAPTITLCDPLAGFLGAAQDGLIEYTYADVVKLAGHSCPTVASAYLMARAGLAALYPGAVPERGGVRVALPDPPGEGVSGVIGAVVGMLTGAAGEGGFHGIGSRFVRSDLLSFGAGGAGVRLTRTDTGAAVSVSAHPERVPADPALRALLPRCVQGSATPQEARQFAALWQDRVRRLLIEHADDSAVIAVEPA